MAAVVFIVFDLKIAEFSEALFFFFSSIFALSSDVTPAMA
jgi:hypothetical protein